MTNADRWQTLLGYKACLDDIKNPKLTEPDVAEACCLVLLASDDMMLQYIQGYGRRGPGCCCYVYMKRLTPASSAFCM